MRRFLSRVLLSLGQRIAPRTTGRDLSGDRQVENAWVAAKLSRGPGLVLDFGSGRSNLSLMAREMGYRVVALDLEQHAIPYEIEREFVQSDILAVDFGERRFDAIISCSTVEHVGLGGRYGSTASPDGDLLAMARLRDWLAPGGEMLLTIPVGVDAVFAPLHRIYGSERLPRLLSGYEVVGEQYYVKNSCNRWTVVEKARAMAERGSESYYGLGLFVLRSAGGGTT